MQLHFDLGVRPALGREDFLVTPSNEAAVALIDAWPHWPSHAALIVGPPGSGKSHLAEVFRQRSSAQRIAAAELAVPDLTALLGSMALVIEDCDAGAFDERAMFHTFNMARQQGAHMLLTATVPVAAWSVNLPDLASRLGAVPSINILLPDDTLLRGVLVKHFLDRQIAINETVITYIVSRIPRSLDAARAVVMEIDRLAMAERAEITRPFVARVLAGFTNPTFFDADP